MIPVVVFVGAVVVIGLVAVESLRWVLRPEARRLRMLKKIGGRR